MQFSEAWLRTFTSPPLDTAGLCDKLTMAGLEVETVGPAAPPFTGVVVARIEAVAPHPDADRLRLCTVDVGAPERLAIVCGAPNAAAGMTVPCAMVGAKLPGGLDIRRARVRGVESSGMLCSARELGLSDDAAGLLPLDASLVPGTDLRAALALDDAVITLKITPNRADCLSLLGVARDVAAVTGSPLQVPAVPAVAVTSAARRAVRVDDPVACPRFAGRVIEGIDAKAPTPAWMKARLERSGIRSISAVVDVTNYVMLELGQPLHAYDDGLLEGSLVVRFARAGETLTLLNGEVLELEPDLLLVADERKPLGLAGIMGGERSGIGDATSTVYLEGAFWNPAVIQGKSRRLGFASDAGYRFERGVDFDGCARGVERATQLIVDICGGRAGPLDVFTGELPARAPVRVRPRRVSKVLGVEVADATIAGHFDRLGLAHARDGDAFVVTPPSFRFDLAIEEDCIEEIARLIGYDAIPAAPSAHVQAMLADPEGELSVNALKRRLAGRDWQEAITFSFVDRRQEALLHPGRDAAQSPIAVLNPIASNLDVMRTTLWAGLLEVLQTNLARRADRVRIFETGRVFLRNGDGPDQPLRIGGIAFGDALPEQWSVPRRKVDFFDVKADLEALAAPRALATARGSHPALHPGRCARVTIDGADAGWIGELHPRLLRALDLPQAPVLFELELVALTRAPVPVAAPVSKLPVVRRDVALVVDEAVPAEAVVAAMRGADIPTVARVALFDVYRGPGVEAGKKSLAILVLMQDTERTLTDADIDAAVGTLLALAASTFGASLRSQERT
jgi:phenylalanyl-tRNA synthetase beta chain